MIEGTSAAYAGRRGSLALRGPFETCRPAATVCAPEERPEVLGGSQTYAIDPKATFGKSAI